MWRAFFLSLGIYSLLLGLECLVIDKAVVAATSEPTAAGMIQRATPAYREIQPPEWAPWSLLSGGAVTILYSFTIPRKMSGA